MDSKPKAGLLQRFFAGVTEQTFQGSLGVPDPALTDYLADLLVRFTRTDVVFRMRGVDGRPLREVAQMLLEGDERIGDARREVHRHIGDFTLFFSGVYPEALKHFRGGLNKDRFIDYRQAGKRSYYIASTIPSEDNGQNRVLKQLSDQFELCVYGLGEVRREWERRDDRQAETPIL